MSPLAIDSPAQLRALVSPVRQEMVDVLVAAGPCSIAQIAAHLGRAPDSLYFHVRRLVRARLLVEQESQKRGRRLAAVYDVAGRPMRIRHVPSAAPLTGRVMKAALRLGARDVVRALASPDAVTEGKRRTLWAGRSKGWVNSAGVRRINVLLGELIEVLQSGRPGRGRRLQSFTFALAPLAPSRRASAAIAKEPL